MKNSLHRLLAALMVALTLANLLPAPAMASDAATPELTETTPASAGEASQEGLEASPPQGNPDESAGPTDNAIQSRPVRLPALRSIPFNNGTIVFTDAELRAALTNSAVSTIYLGHHTAADGTRAGATVNNGTIKMTQGTLLSGAKTIIGTDPENGRRVTLEDRTSNDYVDTMRVPANTKVTLKNMNFTGHNQYGALCSSEVNVAMHFEDVTYAGRQMVFNEDPGCETIFENCNITLKTMDGNAPQELVECGKVIFRGNCTITKASGSDALIWLRYAGSSNGGSIIVEQGADVTINSAGPYLFYLEQNNSSITVAGKLNVAYSSNTGFAANYARLTAMSVSGEMNVTYTSANDYAAVVVSGPLNVTGILRVQRGGGSGNAIALGSNSLTVGPGATLEASRTAGTSALIQASVVTLNNPKRAVLHSAAGPITNTKMDITTRALNYWDGASPNSADTMDNMPKSIWNNNDLSPFSVTATSGSVTQSGLSDGGKGVAPSAVALTSSSFSFANARRLTMGDFTLSLDSPPYNTNTLTGVAPGSAQVKGTQYTPAWASLQSTGVTTADGNGNFTATATNNWGTLGDIVVALAHSDRVKAYTKNSVGPPLQTPAKITAADQSYVYNGQAQGALGTASIAAGASNPPATATGLQSGHRLAEVTISGAQKTYAGETSALTPSAPKIVDSAGTDVTYLYSFTAADSFTAGTLRITPKGGTAPGGKLKITAADQTYTYNGQAQGIVGNNLVLANYAAGSIVTWDPLVAGDAIKTVTIGGSQLTNVGTSDLTPAGAQIVNAAGADVTASYDIDAGSYIKGKLSITPAGGAGIHITALGQSYVYNGQPQGSLGVITLTKGQTNAYASASGLQSGDWLAQVTLAVSGGQPTVPGGYSIVPGSAVIRNASGADVTGNYTLTASNYATGTLTIHKKGNGVTDPNTGGEYPLVIRATDQTYTYNGAAQGILGNGVVVGNYPAGSIATASALVSGDSIKTVNIGGAQATNVGSSDLTPAGAQIVNAANTDVTAYYNIDASSSYVKGKLSITPVGGAGIQITALGQSYVYNGQPQGSLGVITLTKGQTSAYASASGLQSGDWLAQVTLAVSGGQPTVPGGYSIVPGSAVIRNTSGADVTGNYTLTGANYVTGTLTIHKKGSGVTDPATGGEYPLVIRATDQTYTYNGQPQGIVGGGIAVGNYPAGSIATASALVSGDSIKSVAIGGAQATNVGSSDLMPSSVAICNAAGTDVTAYYNIDASSSYVKGELTITPAAGAGIHITAVDQSYIYNGQPQGTVGVVTLAKAQTSAYASASGLQTGDWLAQVTLTVSGGQQAVPGGYSIVPGSAVIHNASGADVSGNYSLTSANYVTGTLTIHKKGSGVTDPATGGEYPLVIRATDQTYTYNGQAQGIVGNGIVVGNYPAGSIATATALVSGDSIKSVNIGGVQATNASTADLTPWGAQIENAAGTDVTAYYNIDATSSYVKGKLTITLAGAGIQITAVDQSYVYNGQPQGMLSVITPTQGQTNAYASASGLQSGDWLAQVTLAVTGGQPTVPGSYTIVADSAVIRNTSGADVTASYSLTASNYATGTLTIHKKGNGITDPNTGGEYPLVIRATDQTYTYNGQPQGIVGGGIAAGNYPAGSIATATALVSGDSIKSVNIGGAQAINASTSDLMPSGAQIVNAANTDVTAYYLIGATSYVKGELTITPASGTGIQITAVDQSYVYNAQPQGSLGVITLTKAQTSAYVSVAGLQTGDWLEQVTLAVSGGQPTVPGGYSIVPGSAVIRNASGADVSGNYTLTSANYVTGTLTIHKKGSGVTDPATGGEYPLVIRATDQTYTYNGAAQGIVGGGIAVGNYPAGSIATASALVSGDSIKSVNIGGAQATNVGDDDLTPSGAQIVNAANTDVTAYYNIDASSSYVKGKLSITPAGGAGIQVTALGQSYVYNGQPQGSLGVITLIKGQSSVYASVTGLQTGDWLAQVTLAVSGGQQAVPGGYSIVPGSAVIRNASGVDVSGNYSLTGANYAAGTLTIHKKGSGVTDPNTGGEYPLVIRATDQSYVYNGQPQGIVGGGIVVGNYPAGSIATATALVSGDVIKTVAIGGAQATSAGTSDLTPSGAQIVNAAGTDVTAYYNIDASSSYVKGKLTITAAGGGTQITAVDQAYVYNGQPQGSLGVITLTKGQSNAYASASGLQTGDWLAQVTLTVSGGQQTVPGGYSIVADSAVIRNASGTDVTGSYSLTASSYVTGTLTIHKKGNGVTDPNTGGEYPLVIRATDQTHTYNGQPQGIVGGGIAVGNYPAGSIATASALVNGDSIKSVAIGGAQATNAGSSDLTPSGAQIVNAANTDVTAYYLIGATSYVKGKLTITPMGGTAPGGKLKITATDQTYTYNGQPQGIVGNDLVLAGYAAGSVATSDALAAGDSVKMLTIGGRQATNVGTSDLTPSGAQIVNAAGIDVTANYDLDATSYIKGKLTIKSMGGPAGGKLKITSADQTYPYNGQPQGIVGGGLTVANYTASIVTSDPLAAGDSIKTITIGGSQRTDVGSDDLAPSAAVIVNVSGTDVTANYDLDATSYIKGKLTITPKGNPGGGKFKITAADQTYTYNGQPQGIVGGGLTVASYTAGSIVTSDPLGAGDAIKTISIGGQQATNAGTSDLTPSGAQIVNAAGIDVTANYDIDATSYIKGKLTITPVGGVGLKITALDQHYTYNEQPQGNLGVVTLIQNQANAYVTATGLQQGDWLAQATLSVTGGKPTDPGAYPIIPSAAVIRDSAGKDVTASYTLTAANYVNNTLTIHKKGSGTIDPGTGGETPLQIEATDQTYTYNGQAQGLIGAQSVTAGQASPLVADATGAGLLPGHVISYVRLSDGSRTDVGASDILPQEIKIYRGTTDVTAYYLIDATSYKSGGKVSVTALAIEVQAADQTHVYDDQPGGVFGNGLTVSASSPATASGLAAGDLLSNIDLKAATPDANRVNAGAYNQEILPSAAKIYRGGTDVTANYALTYKPGKLTIERKGSGSNNSLPLPVTAQDQSYPVTGSLQGVVGINLATSNYAADFLVKAALLPGHAIKVVDIGGTQCINVGDTSALTPANAKIIKNLGQANETDVTANYNLDYVKGKLSIYVAGNTPIKIVAKDQAYTYNGQAQGVTGLISVDSATSNPYVSVTGLMGTDILTVTLSVRESAHTKPGAYHLDVSGATVKHADGSDATGNYTIDPSASYVSGALTIYPKGNGTPDSNGGELPLIVAAKDQTYTYNGQPQGTVGTASNPAAALATATALLPGHKLSSVYLGDSTGQRTQAGTYDLPIAAVKIADGFGNDVTDCYLVDTAAINNQTYVPAKLIIQPIGALTITALPQKYAYDGAPQGSFGVVDQTGSAALATATGLAAGDSIAYVTLSAKTADANRIVPNTYAGEIIPSQVKIHRGTGFNAVDVTASYVNIGYVAGNLTITKRGDGVDANGDPLPLKIIAKDQTYPYNGALQGTVGVLTAPSSALVEVRTALPADQTLASLTLDGARKKDVDNAADPAHTLTPRAAAIMKDYGLPTQQNVTAYYLIDSTSYVPGKLSITPPGQSNLKITALDQTYTYDGTAQGVLGALSENGANPQIAGGQSPYVKAEGLFGGDRLAGVTLSVVGGAKKNPGSYAIAASAASIVDANGNDVTGNYTLTGVYAAGTLAIDRKPLTITAADQTYTYDGTAQGVMGSQANPGAALAQASPGLAAGDRITAITLSGNQRVTPGDERLMPGAAQIYAGGENVTACYDISYAEGKLTVKKRGNADGAPLTVTAQPQSFAYDGTERGTFGTGLSISQSNPLAVAANLAAGHTLARVSILRKDPLAVPYVNAGAYTGALIPAQAVIADAAGADVTACYDIDAALSYIAGTLTITKVGGPGTTPATITANDQSFVYNDQLQGDMGNGLPGSLVTASGLAAGDFVDSISIGGQKQTLPGVYRVAGKGTLIPSGAVIRNATGVDVTGNYQGIAYLPGTLTIYPKGNGTPDSSGGEKPLTVEAAQQTYMYNGQPQGKVGASLSVDALSPVATATGLLPGHRMKTVDILGGQLTTVGSAPITPDNVKIFDAASKDVTAYYRIDPVTSYIPSTLNIVQFANANVLVIANDQLYVYNGQPQGVLGTVNLTSAAGASAASATGLISGHRLAEVVLTSNPAAPCVEPGDYALSVVSVKIVDAASNDVTASYGLTAQNFADGTLTIQRRGGGIDPSTGRELPLIITALDQRYVYDGTAKGDFGAKSGAAAIAAVATVKDALVPGDVLSALTISKKTPGGVLDAGAYPGELVPGALSITRNGVDVTSKYYYLDATSYVPGDLTIEKKGNGVDPNTGEQLPFLIYAQGQRYEYDGQLHGVFGTALPNDPQLPLANAVGLVAGHTLTTITLTGKTGGQRTEPGDYIGELVSSAAIIRDAAGNDVTRNYKIEAVSYVPGNLIIDKKGFNGGPIRITAWDQYYVYNGTYRGEVNKTLTGSATKPAAKAEGLLPGDYVQSVYISGARQSEPGVYTNTLLCASAHIVDALGASRDAYYNLTAAGYAPGTLTIFKKGNGVVADPDTGREEPLQIIANRQDHIYDGTPKGTFGVGLDLTLPANTGLVSVPGLLGGIHEARAVMLGGVKRTEPNVYPDALEPMGIVIVAKGDATGTNIADRYYDIDGTAYSNGASYVRGDLVVHKKGSGDPDPATGGELPLTIAAAHQAYPYNGQPQGKVGAQSIAQGEQNPVAAAKGLLPGHYLAGVTLDGAQQTNPTAAPVPLLPKGPIVIKDANGNDCTSKYLIDAQASFPAAGYGSLTITPKGGVAITAEDQNYIYNGAPQGKAGSALAAAGLATAQGLIPGHALSAVSIASMQAKEPNSHLLATFRPMLTPSGAQIIDSATNADVTTYYTNITYAPGRLTVYPKGNGVPDGNGGEKPLIVTAQAQEYTYNGSAQGTHGADVDPSLTVDVTAGALVAGQWLEQVDLAVTQNGAAAAPINAGVYNLTPSKLRIFSPTDGDVTDCYNLASTSYVSGPLTIYKKGNGVPVGPGAVEEQPLVITAQDQTYAYNGTAQGEVGTGLTNDPTAPLAAVTALVPGHRLQKVDILGAQWAQVTGANPRPLTPHNAVIMDGPGANAVNVTANYNIVPRSYVDGGLHIVGAQNTGVRITAQDQLYVYDGTPKGILGTVAYDASRPGQLVAISGLFYGDTLVQVTLGGGQQTEPGDTPLTPIAAKIMRGTTDVTANYGLTAANFAPGTLTVQKRGDGVDINGRSIPLTIKAKDQCYTYNGQPQGDIGVKSAASATAAVAEPLPAGVLLPGDSLSGIRISGQTRTYPTEPASVLTPSEAKIADANGNDRSKYYLLEAVEGAIYLDGKLTIRKRGDGVVDPNTNREGPLLLRAQNQEYTYNGGPQGIAGALTDPTRIAAAAQASNLATGHSIGIVIISGGSRTDAGVYTLMPSAAQIFDGTTDVTPYYETIDYRAGNLIIRKIGENGTTGAVITATDQTYAYDGTPKGIAGAQADPAATVAIAQGLAGTDRLQYVYIGAPAQRVVPGTYELQPQQAAIHNGTADVTHNYVLSATSYIKGTLTITKGAPITITAKDQYYVYNRLPQGIVGDMQNNLSAVVTVTGLPAGHTLERVYLDGAQQTLPTTTPEILTPRNARIYYNGVDVTSNFDLTSAYVPGKLIVDQKGSGPDPITGVELPLFITAKDQTYTYNGQPQGKLGTFTTRTADKPNDLSIAKALLPGDSLASLELTGARLTAPGTGPITPTNAKIQDQNGADVTACYKITPVTYLDGTLTIRSLGIVFKPLDQHHTYNGAMQGDVADVLRPHDPRNPLAALVSGALLPGHRLAEVRVTGNQQWEPGEYKGELTLAEVRIMDGANDVTAMYDVSFGANATLFIHKKGSGDPDPGAGGEKPLIIQALDQTYLYDDTLHGYAGAGLDPAAASIPIVQVTQLVPGHRVALVDIGGAQRTEAGTSPLTPYGIRIVDTNGFDVTRYYRIEPTSYLPGLLSVERRGKNGTTQPLRVEANDQTYHYNGQPQGVVGQNLTFDPLAPVVTVMSLLPGHFVGRVTIDGTQRIQSGTYTDALVPADLRIFKKEGSHTVDVTASYILDASSYVPADLVILQRGVNNPIRVLASDQSYIYNGQPQGRVGTQALTPGDLTPVAITEQLLGFGDRLAQVTIDGVRQITPGVYTDTLVPTAPIIRDAQNVDLTAQYRFTDPALFGKGTLTIYPKGNGDPDPSTGGELPLTIRAKDQSYLYDEAPHGVVGPLTTPTDIAQYIEVRQLVPGHTVQSVTIGSATQTALGEYPLTPTGIVIIDQNGNQVQQNYRITPASYIPGKLLIYKKGNGEPDPNGGEKPLRITALDQSFVYNGTARGAFGQDLIVDPAKPLVSVQALLPGHRLARITLTGQASTNPGVYRNAVIPSDPQILDQNGRDVTAHYRIEAISFVPGTLTIRPKGSGDGNGTEPEPPMIIRAADQHYVYNGAAQGKVGKVLLAEDPQHPAATAIGLLPGHKLLSVTLGGKQQRLPNIYRDALTPTQVQIVDASGADVTRFYNLAPEGFVPGTLTIHPKGNGVPDGKGGELPLRIEAQEQSYSYSGKPRGKFGTALKNAPGDLWATAEGLLPGDQLYWIGLYGTRRTARDRYTDAIMPGTPVIHGSGGQDVTGCYLITKESFVPADLVIGMGSGTGTGSGLFLIEAEDTLIPLVKAGSPLGIDPENPFRAYPNLSARDVGDGLE